MRFCARSGWAGVFLVASALVSAQVAPIPMAGELPGRPFAIQKKWIIGGVGDWGYLTLDTAAGQLFIAHGPTVQVVDLTSGNLVGTVTGLHNARAIVLANSDGYGYVTDGPASEVKVFDRTTLQVVGSMPTGPEPRALALDPSSGLLVAICGAPTSTPSPEQAQHGQASRNAAASLSSYRALHALHHGPLSTLAFMDPQSRKTLALVVVPGDLGFASDDADGHLYVSDESRDLVERFDLQAMANEIEKETARVNEKQAAAKPHPHQAPSTKPLQIDWSWAASAAPPADVLPFAMRLNGGCRQPRGIAVDSKNYRLFVACANQKLVILNSQTGASLASLTIGPGADSVAYDPSRSLIFTANGGGYGSLTVVQQHITDTYAVIQNLPTLAHARTMAVDPSTGHVYLVTTLYGADLSHPPVNGIGTLKMSAVDGSFQVLVIGR